MKIEVLGLVGKVNFRHCDSGKPMLNSESIIVKTSSIISFSGIHSITKRTGAVKFAGGKIESECNVIYTGILHCKTQHCSHGFGFMDIQFGIRHWKFDYRLNNTVFGNIHMKVLAIKLELPTFT